MRLNKFLAEHTRLSRRKADEAIEAGRVYVNEAVASIGMDVTSEDLVTLDGNVIAGGAVSERRVLLFNKPFGYVCSRDGQGSPTIYELLPQEYHHLNIAGRLDKDSCGLVVLTNDGELINELTHPSNDKEKIYLIRINEPLTETDIRKLKEGVDIGDDRPSMFSEITPENDIYRVVLQEGRNRQVRRSIEALGKRVVHLQRIALGPYELGHLDEKSFAII